MTVQLEFWQVNTLLIAFLTFLFAAGRMLLSQIDRRLDDRFEAMEKARVEGGRHLDDKFGAVLEQNRLEAQGWASLERDFLRFQADLPVLYVRREDYVRGQSVIEAKLDALYNKLEVVQMKGANNG